MRGVQQHVKQGELNLPHRLHSALKVTCGQHLVKQGSGQSFARIDVGGHVLKYIPFPAKIFHELAGQFNRIPFHTANPRDIAFIDLAEQVVQAVAKLMKQGGDIVMREQSGLGDAIDFAALRKVANQVRHGSLQLFCIRTQPAGAHIVHPSATALTASGAGVKVKLPDQFHAGRARTFNAVKAHIGIPNRRRIGANRDFKQGLDNFEQACQDFRESEILFDFLLAESVAGFFELFADKGPIPGLWIVEA